MHTRIWKVDFFYFHPPSFGRTAVKGTVSRDFWLQVFSRVIFLRVPEYPISSVLKVSQRCGQFKMHHGTDAISTAVHRQQIFCRRHWHRWQIFRWCHNDQCRSRETCDRQFQRHQRFAAGVNGVSVKFSAGVNDTGNAPLVVDTFANFLKIKMALLELSEARGRII